MRCLTLMGLNSTRSTLSTCALCRVEDEVGCKRISKYSKLLLLLFLFPRHQLIIIKIIRPPFWAPSSSLLPLMGPSVPCLLSLIAKETDPQLRFPRNDPWLAGQDWLISCHGSIPLQLMGVITQRILGLRTMKHQSRRKLWRLRALAEKNRGIRNRLDDTPQVRVILVGNPSSPLSSPVNLEGQGGCGSSPGPHTPHPSTGIHADVQIWAALRQITKVQGMVAFYSLSFEV